uniref:Cell wall hydrolase SleB domain-containing protein n=1 Tax=Alexandrium monilatum TaxID=311494 RepID=A0A7S4QD03_9DINO
MPPKEVERKRKIADVAKTIFNEARGEGMKGMDAVAHVIANRTSSKGFPNEADAVVSARTKNGYQFDGFKASLPTMRDPADQKAYRYCEDLADKLVKKQKVSDTDPTGGALYFDASRTSFDSWGRDKLQYTTQIGAHHFFAERPQNSQSSGPGEQPPGPRPSASVGSRGLSVRTPVGNGGAVTLSGGPRAVSVGVSVPCSIQ